MLVGFGPLKKLDVVIFSENLRGIIFCNHGIDDFTLRT